VSQRPLFLLSIPRSGSTLAQRVLAAHEEIATASEPWILLPQLYAMCERGAYAEYGQVPAARAIKDFVQQLPNGEDDYLAELRGFMLGLYEKASRGKGSYFLDKTPRYHFIVEDLFRLFPDGKFIFLWRNPLAVVASIVETWAGGRWNLERWRRDLFAGVAHLVDSYKRHSGLALAVRYEDLVTDPDANWPSLFDYLDLPFDPAVLTSFASIRLEGRMGDRSGTGEYHVLTTEPIDKWKATIATPLRKQWCRRYLHYIGERRLATMGYDIHALLDELNQIPSRPISLGADLARSSAAWAGRVARETAARLLWS
jgi:hypothetical protein